MLTALCSGVRRGQRQRRTWERLVTPQVAALSRTSAKGVQLKSISQRVQVGEQGESNVDENEEEDCAQEVNRALLRSKAV